MITKEQNQEIIFLVEELLSSQINYEAELITGHDWETYRKILDDDKAALKKYLDEITT
ncbi:hypothetical protein CPT_Melville_104 [Salmonella phage Melville]|uniref:Uncharacterized protein n=1 Tax=Salmonella phage Melville TaxID=2041413 RepID=A0A2D1GMA0_9CAUD|nr:hypothetical protein FDI73_gp104 [Salmonella phage Melville]ATN93078.1 hypothetical protein CPT_Melville_104 [Salmonella phage Melville]UPW42478.1 hypothetical protein EBPHNEJP_00180 [Salmonella phage CF-SP2]